MRKLLLVILLFWCFYSQGQISFVPASPYPLEIEQVDGTTISILGKGDEKYFYSTTEDDYTIIKNHQGIYEYAELDSEKKLIPSGIKASKSEERTGSEKTYLSTKIKNLKPEIFENSLLLKSSGNIESIQRDFPSSGNRKILLLLIAYPDLEDQYTLTDFSNLMNQPNYNGTGSFRDYFQSVSYNALNLTVDVAGWYLASNNYEYYGAQNGYDRAQELVEEAIDAAEAAGVDFSQYDNNGDGYVDNLMVVHSGPGAEEGGLEQYVWSHNWVISNQKIYDGVILEDYTIQPETRDGGSSFVGIGVFCHEFGHALGLPDLYDTNDSNGESEGLGEWCLMAYGSWLGNEKKPSLMSAWCRDELNWINPLILNSEGNYDLLSAATSTQAYRINTQNYNEYFLLENRYKTGFDSYLKVSGMAIYHINTNRSNNDDENLKLVDLEEADGDNDLDNTANKGDSGDLFPGSSNNTSFTDFTNPDAQTYDPEETGINIHNIALNGSTVSFYFGEIVVPEPNLTYVPAQNNLNINNNTIDIGLQIENNGDEASGVFTVGYYLSSSNPVTTSDNLIGTDNYTNLDSSASANENFSLNLSTLPWLQPGNYYTGYVIDNTDIVDESDEEDNSYTFPTTINYTAQSNLTYNAGENDLSINGTDVTINLQVRNNGDASSNSHRVGYYLSEDLNITQADQLFGTDPVSILGQGQASNESISEDLEQMLPGLTPGTYYIGYIIDYLDEIAEQNENDNTYVFSSQPFDYCPADLTIIQESICSGDSVFFYNSYQKNEGIYQVTLTNQWGCDSVVRLDLTVYPSYDQVFDMVLCEGDSFLFGNEYYHTSGLYTKTYQTIHGCDSIVTLNLHINPKDEIDLYESVCEGDSVIVGQNVYKTEGVYINNLVNQYGCDSIVTLYLDVNPHNDTFLFAEICSDDSVVISNSVYRNTGIYIDTLMNRFGCDSVVTLDLIVYPSYDILTEKIICEGDSVVFNGFVYKTSGIYAEIYTTVFGCDSIVTLNLTVNPIHDTLLIAEICEGESYPMGGADYVSSGIYTTVLTNRFGCDSTVTLDLTVFPVNDTTLFVELCQGESIKIGNNSYNTTGYYTETLSNQYGCDSVVNLVLEIHPVHDTTLYVSICEGESYSINGNTYEYSGEYTHGFTNQYGCDSTVTLILQVNPLPVVWLGNDTLIFSSQTLLLDAGNGYVRYLWSTGETSSTIETKSSTLGLGDHEIDVTVTDENQCSGTGNIKLTIINDTDPPGDPEPNISLYPNPSTGLVNILLEKISGKYEIRIFDNSGQLVYLEEDSSGGNKFIKTLNISNLRPGTYTLQIINRETIMSDKLVILQ